MKRLLSAFLLVACCVANAQQLASPDQNLELKFGLSPKGEPTYELSYKKKAVIKTSKLGLELKGTPSFLDGFQIDKSEKSSFDETWSPVLGEQKNIRNHYNELLVTLSQKA